MIVWVTDSLDGVIPEANGAVIAVADAAAANRVVLYSPNGTGYRLVVADDGALSTTAI